MKDEKDDVMVKMKMPNAKKERGAKARKKSCVSERVK
jgi:hypothetical protein